MFIRRFGRSAADCFQLALQIQQFAMVLIVQTHREFSELEKLLADVVQTHEENDDDDNGRG